MTRSLIPPHYVNVPSSLAYGELSRTVIVTGLRIYGLGWRHRYTRTDPIAIADLCAVCGVSRSKLYEHLGRLVTARMLQYTNTAGRFTFTFRPDRSSPVFGTDQALGVVVDPDSDSCSKSPENQQQQYSHGFEGGCGGDAIQSRFPDWQERLAVLDRVGVLEPVRSEIAGLGHITLPELEAWETWFASQSKLGVGALIAQLRAGVPPPAGARAGAPDVKHDYISGEYAEYIQH